MGGAKNCPETPRQKMIGMMYLVLTAMLALNVSADILNGFTKLRHSMEGSMTSTKFRSEDAFANFEAAYNMDGGEKKYGDWYRIACAVRTECDDFYAYIDTFKLDIINLIDGTAYPYGTPMEEINVNNNGDTNKPHQYALVESGRSGKLHADEFKERMDAYRTYLTVVDSKCLLDRIAKDPKFAHDWKLKRDMMASLFSTDDVESEEREMITWQHSTFDEMPAGAVLALLTKYQNDVRVAENDLINFMYSAAGSSDFVVNKVEALPIALNGEYIMQGDRYKAKIVSAMVDTNQVPRVFINGHELESNIYEVAAGSVGQQTYSGYILVGTDTTHYNFKGQYTVGAPSATISNTDLNIMYRGYDNPFSISVPGVSSDKLRVTCAGATITKSGSQWIIKPTGASEKAVIEVSADVDGKGKVVSMGKMEYRVKTLPQPNSYFVAGDIYYDGAAKGKVARKHIVDANSKVVADYGPDGLVKAKFKITKVAIKFPSGKLLESKSDKFSAQMLGEIKKLKAGSSLTIATWAIGPDGKEIQLRSLPLEMN